MTLLVPRVTSNKRIHQNQVLLLLGTQRLFFFFSKHKCVSIKEKQVLSKISLLLYYLVLALLIASLCYLRSRSTQEESIATRELWYVYCFALLC